MPAEGCEFLLINDFKTRPNAKSGSWVMLLLPLSLIISFIKHPIILTPTYKLTTLLSTGLLLTSLIIVYQKHRNQRLTIINIWTILALLLTSKLFHVCLHKGWLFSIVSAFISTLVYFKTYIEVLRKLKECFTFGEAGLVSQSVIILLYCTLVSFANSRNMVFSTNMQISTLIIQMGLIGIGVIARGVYEFNIRNMKTFYFFSFTVLIFIIYLPLYSMLERCPVLWILTLIFSDLSTLKLIIYWSFCTGIAVLTVSNQIFYAKKASTSMRKIFHFLVVVVYIPGLLYRCSFLYLASGVALGIFFVLEILRILNIPPLGPHLQDGFVVYSDEKDTGNLALTPVYLLTACSLPLWIHPAPCDVTDSAMFNLIPLLSGILSIGVGDAAASIIGSNYGRHFWPGSKKTIEGTVACILLQIGLIHLLVYFGCVNNLSSQQTVKLYLAILITSLVEAKTTQVDNLVLPLIMYIILI